jgi:hypothetical protein
MGTDTPPPPPAVPRAHPAHGATGTSAIYESSITTSTINICILTSGVSGARVSTRWRHTSNHEAVSGPAARWTIAVAC